jgi:hypothetical protein
MRFRRILKTSVVLSAFTFIFGVAAFAQQYQIINADYGAGNQRVDVTQKLQQIAASNSTFRMGNSTFGVDPAPDVVKTLRIFARDSRGGTRTFEYREGSTVDGSQFSGWNGGNWGGPFRPNFGTRPGEQFQILRADYGAGNRRIDVTQRLQQLAASNQTFRMGNDTFGTDPAPGTVKTLRIYARSTRGHNRTFEYPENSLVDGALFTGWSGGNWGPGPSGQYQITRVDYGAGVKRVDVTQRLQQLAASNRTFRMGNDTFGVDPAPGVVKTLRIFARDTRGGSRTFEYREGSTVDGAQFTGWSGGSWGGIKPPGRP